MSRIRFSRLEKVLASGVVLALAWGIAALAFGSPWRWAAACLIVGIGLGLSFYVGPIRRRGRYAPGARLLRWIMMIASAALAGMILTAFGCAGTPSGVPRAGTASPGPMIVTARDEIEAAGKALPVLADRIDAQTAELAGRARTPEEARAPVQRILDATGEVRATGSKLIQAALTLHDARQKLDQIVREREEIRRIAAAQEARAVRAERERDDADRRAMLARAGWFGVGIVAALAAVGLGIWLRNLYVMTAGLVAAGVCFLGVLVFAALAWVLAHLWLVIGVTVLVVGAAVAAVVTAWKRGWLTWPALNGTAAKLRALIWELDADAPNVARARTLAREAGAIFRSDPDGSRSWERS